MRWKCRPNRLAKQHYLEAINIFPQYTSKPSGFLCRTNPVSFPQSFSHTPGSLLIRSPQFQMCEHRAACRNVLIHKTIPTIITLFPVSSTAQWFRQYRNCFQAKRRASRDSNSSLLAPRCYDLVSSGAMQITLLRRGYMGGSHKLRKKN